MIFSAAAAADGGSGGFVWLDGFDGKGGGEGGSGFRWPSSRPLGSQALSSAETNRLELRLSVFTVTFF